MSAERKHKEKSAHSHLQVIRGGQYYAKQNRIDHFWQLCHATMWSKEQFTETEVSEFKRLISGHFKKEQNADRIFYELVQRVCLAMRYINRYQHRYVPSPFQWLNVHNQKGLAGTATWLELIEEKRKKQANFHQGISVLAAAILAYSNKRSPNLVCKYRKQLLDLQEFDLLRVFYNTIVHIHYLNH